MFKSNCPHCNSEKTYNLVQNYNRCKDKPCRSCANSFSRGGKGKSDSCIQCGEEKYGKSSSLCRTCHIARSQKYHKEHYKYARYGTTKEWYEQEVKKGCAICGSTLIAYPTKYDLKPHIDHDHKTGIVRGVLCGLCNKGLGQFKDSISNLENAIQYLKNNKKNNE